jgi:hypothetical protein
MIKVSKSPPSIRSMFVVREFVIVPRLWLST